MTEDQMPFFDLLKKIKKLTSSFKFFREKSKFSYVLNKKPWKLGNLLLICIYTDFMDNFRKFTNTLKAVQRTRSLALGIYHKPWQEITVRWERGKVKCSAMQWKAMQQHTLCRAQQHRNSPFLLRSIAASKSISNSPFGNTGTTHRGLWVWKI